MEVYRAKTFLKIHLILLLKLLSLLNQIRKDKRQRIHTAIILQLLNFFYLPILNILP